MKMVGERTMKNDFREHQIRKIPMLSTYGEQGRGYSIHTYKPTSILERLPELSDKTEPPGNAKRPELLSAD